MKSGIWKSFALSVLALMVLPISKATGQSKEFPLQTDSMTFWHAQRVSIAALEYVRIQQGWHYEFINRDSIHLTIDSLEFDASDAKHQHHYKLLFASTGKVSTNCRPYSNIHFNYYNCSLIDRTGKKLRISPVGEEKAHADLLFWPSQGRFCGKDPGCLHAAVSFAAAFNRLQEFAADPACPLCTFHQQVATWRALNPKPPLPEAVRQQRLLAENALKEKQPEEALNRYEAGLELYPTWPQGCFNAALIAAELRFYSQAVEHMQSYLELVPDAPDAKAARDQIVIWQDKAGQHRSTGDK